jgi:two-component system cell cycle sensor histidine kinase/response regulator CckA
MVGTAPINRRPPFAVPAISPGFPAGTDRHLRAAIDALPDPFAIHTAIRDASGRIVDFNIDYVNRATASFNGLPVRHQIGGRLLELFPAMRGGALFKAFVRVVETGRSYAGNSIVYEDPAAAGGAIRSILDVRAVKLGDGYVVSSRDLTAAARSDLALQASEERSRLLVEQSSEAILVLDGHGQILEANPACGLLLGVSAGALVGRAWATLLDPGTPADAAGLYRRLSEGRTLRFECALRRADGGTVAVEFSARMLSDGRFLLTGRDIGERLHAEQTRRLAAERLEAAHADLEQSTSLLRAIVEGTADHIHVKDLAGRYILVNRADADWFGLPAADILGRTDADILDPEEGARVAVLDRAVLDAAAVRTYEQQATRDGVTRTWLTTKDVVRDERGATIGVFAISREVTEQRNQEAQLRQAAKLEALGQLAGGIAHDFNNILTAIRGYADLVRLALPDELEQERADLTEVVLGAERAASLTRQLLAFSRLQVLQPTVLEPADVVRGIAPMLRRLLGEHIDLLVPASAEPLATLVDRAQLEQVIVNLAVNARDAMPDGGRLSIETSAADLDEDDVRRHPGATPGPHVVLAVSDTGMGIEPAARGHIFEPFFTTKEPGKGTGMGLATVYGIVKQSGGTIDVDSEPGFGTTIKVYFPRVAETGTPLSVAAREPAVIGGSETILLVEDESSIRSFARRSLEAHGYRVLEAENGEVALEVARAEGSRIDLLVTDVIMPGMQGTMLADQLTRLQPGLRVLFASGYSGNTAFAQRVLPAGTPYLSKPYSSAALAVAVRGVLDGVG